MVAAIRTTTKSINETPPITPAIYIDMLSESKLRSKIKYRVSKSAPCHIILQIGIKIQYFHIALPISFSSESISLFGIERLTPNWKMTEFELRDVLSVLLVTGLVGYAHSSEIDHK